MSRPLKDHSPDDKAVVKMQYQANCTLTGDALERKKTALTSMKIVDGKAMSYGKYLHDYLRNMSFTYQASGANAGKYRRICEIVEGMCKTQWDKYPNAEK